jgi:hypothetical protein
MGHTIYKLAIQSNLYSKTATQKSDKKWRFKTGKLEQNVSLGDIQTGCLRQVVAECRWLLRAGSTVYKGVDYI